MNHYAFHIMDRDWGHMIIRFCPHPPFNVLVILNGHEWVAKEAERRRLALRKQDNCFTELSNARDLGLVAETLSSPESSVGRLVQAPERWIYSAVLCFALDVADQERQGSATTTRSSRPSTAATCSSRAASGWTGSSAPSSTGSGASWTCAP